MTGADSATLLIAAATSYKNYKDVSGDPETLTKKRIRRREQKSFEALRKDHIAEHQRLFRRVQLDLGTTDAAKLPTDERIKNFAKGNDPQLAALYFQFGRYLLISSSRPGCQPANLQGIWNESMNPPWGSKYTININTEMNYWPAESCNLAECVEPLVGHGHGPDRNRRTHGQESIWDARGWVAHHNTDLWRATAPIDGPQIRHVAHGRRVALPAPLGTLSIHRRQEISGENLSGDERRGAILPRYPRRRTEA